MAAEAPSFVVIDPRLIATAFVARSNGRCRRLLALLALGRCRVSAERAGEALAGLSAERRQGLQELAERALERARSRLTPEAPDRFALAWSTPLRDDLRDELHYRARELPSIRGHDEWIASALHQVATAVTGTNASDHEMRRVHRYTGYSTESQRGDRLIQTAIKTGAAHVVSNDESVAPPDGRTYHSLEGDGTSTVAVPLSRFVKDQVESEIFTLKDLDRDAFEAVSATVTPVLPPP